MAVEDIGERDGLTRAGLAKLIDHTLLRGYATEHEVVALCDEALAHGFASVTVNPTWVTCCAGRLTGTGVCIDATVGFPLGATTALIKVEETREAVRHGAGEIDMAINIGALRSGYHDYVEREIAAVVKAAGPAAVKVILETCRLTDDEKAVVCGMALRSGARFVKTSTGFDQAGATVADVALLREVVGTAMGVKAAGGIRTLAGALALLDAGADRLGTSAGVRILQEIPE